MARMKTIQFPSRKAEASATPSPKIVLLGFLSLLLAGVAVAQEGVSSSPIVKPELHHDTSAPLSELATEAPVSGVPHLIKPLGRRPGMAVSSAEPDPVVQQVELPLVTTTNGLNFDGIRDLDGAAPADPNASVGATQVVEVVNTSFQVFDKKTGKSLLGPAEVKSVFKGFSQGSCDGSSSSPLYADPVVLYDKAARRWLITIIESDNMFANSTECIAVSATSDATGAYHRYAFTEDFFLDDYPKFGVWPDAYYESSNEFLEGLQFVETQQCAFDRANMLNGGPANAICFQTGGTFSFLPSDLDGPGVARAGEPNFFLELNPNDATSFNLYKFHVDFADPSNSTFTGPTRIPVAPYKQACAGGTCIPQLGTTQRLDSLGDRLMFRLAYRNFGSHESLVVTHSVARDNIAASNVRWYEIRNPNTTPVVFQQGTFGSGNTSLWMASIGMDKAGDIAFGFSGSSNSIHPSIGYTGRMPTDPKGTMESPALIFNGKGSQTQISRWGDYSSISIDPVDDCTFWYAQQYIPSNGSFNWHTRLASFKFNNCH